MSARKNPMRRKGTHKDQRSGKKTVSYRTTKNLEFGEYEKGVFHPWSRRPYSVRKKTMRKLNAKNPGELVILGLNPRKLTTVSSIQTVIDRINERMASDIPRSEFDRLSSYRDRLKARQRAILAREEKQKRSRRRNAGPLARAKQMFSKFHGRQASGVYEMQRSAKARKDYTILGPLVAIGINAEKFDQIIRHGENWDVEQWDKLPHLAFMSQSEVNEAMRVLKEPNKYLKNTPMLAADPNGKQLYVISEEPLEIDISRFDTDAGKDFVDLGEATFVNYVASKPSSPKEWIHTFGEEGGTRPRLVYDKLNKSPMFVGGSYRIEAPGIIN